MNENLHDNLKFKHENLVALPLGSEGDGVREE
jgi:hypothetical protein